MAGYPVVLNCDVSKTLLGAWKLAFECPGCRSKLASKEDVIATVDTCPICSIQFTFDQRVADHVAASKSAAESKKEAQRQEADRRKQEAEHRNQEAEALRRQRLREYEIALREEEARRTADAKAREHNRGYEYPNLERYQSSLELIAVLGALALCLLGAAFLIGAAVSAQQLDSAGAAAVLVVIAISFFGAAASWYFWWMVWAELLRLVITVALDVRMIRDKSNPESSGSKGARTQ